MNGISAVIDIDSMTIVSADEALAELSGYSSAELTGKAPFIFSEIDYKNIQQQMVFLNTKSGQAMHVKLIAVPLPDPERNAVSLTLQPLVTKKKKTAKELRLEAQKTSMRLSIKNRLQQHQAEIEEIQKKSAWESLGYVTDESAVEDSVSVSEFEAGSRSASLDEDQDTNDTSSSTMGDHAEEERDAPARVVVEGEPASEPEQERPRSSSILSFFRKLTTDNTGVN